MSEKLTEEKIEELIAELLQERVSFPDDIHKYKKPDPKGIYEPRDFPHVKKNSALSKKHLNIIMTAAKENNEFDDDDLKFLEDNPDKITMDHVKAVRYMIQSFRDALKNPTGPYKKDPAKKQAEQAIESLLQLEKAYDEFVQSSQQPDSTITAPEFSTKRAALGTGTTAPFPPEQLAIVKRAMGGTSNILDKIQKISSISRGFYETSQTPNRRTQPNIRKFKNKPPSELLNDIMLLDIFNLVIKDMDSGAGAYLFEYLMAMLVEGRVTGKETTDEGKMGATDFITKDNVRGSAKYYSQPSSIEQAAGGFLPNEVVQYVVGIKKEDVDDTGGSNVSKGGKADPARIVAVDLFYFSVTANDTLTRFTTGGRGGKKVDTEKTTGKDGKERLTLKLSGLVNSSTYKGTLYLTSAATSNFANMVDDAIAKTGETIQQSYIAMKSMFAEMKEAQQKVKVYISSGDIDQGNEAFESLQGSENSFATIVDKLSTESGYGSLQGNKIVEESKMQTLDKLIDETLRDIKRKRKK